MYIVPYWLWHNAMTHTWYLTTHYLYVELAGSYAAVYHNYVILCCLQQTGELIMKCHNQDTTSAGNFFYLHNVATCIKIYFVTV